MSFNSMEWAFVHLPEIYVHNTVKGAASQLCSLRDASNTWATYFEAESSPQSDWGFHKSNEDTPRFRTVPHTINLTSVLLKNATTIWKNQPRLVPCNLQRHLNWL